jgi:adenosylmethionine-8-amino-7-oxononanoate aminotransferase
VFYRKLGVTLPKIVRGRGCWLYDDAGNAYLDAAGGAYVANLGHGVSEIARAMSEQAESVAYVNGTAFTHTPVEELASEVAALSPMKEAKCLFLSSGSEAIEAALKLARQYWVDAGHPERHRIITTTPGYHGATLLALSASARRKYREYFEPWLVPVTMIPAPYAYRCPCQGRAPLCPACSGAALEEALASLEAGTVAAFLVEPIGGSSTGASVPDPGYFKRVRELCDQHGVLLVVDEVLTGAGRTGKWSAIEHFGVEPDLQVLGKGLSGGYAPLSAVVVPRRLVDVMAAGAGEPMHAQTFCHHPVACAAGLATLRMLERDRLVERCAALGEVLQLRLASLRELPGVGDIRGRGLLAGIELVADKGSRAPFARSLHVAERVVHNAQARGLVLWPNTGHVSGGDGDTVLVAPPFVISESEIDEIVMRLRAAIGDTLSTT